jgi:hypothetical protein
MRALTALLVALVVAAAQAQTVSPLPPPAKPPPAAAAPPQFVAGHRVINWDEPVPPGWDPMKEFKVMNPGALTDSDPRAAQLMKKLREVWDNAPANPALDGQAVRIPGFVVPLEESKDGLKEFLVVPCFGACIYSPPPPANQIVHVLPQSAARGVRLMDAVWISGKIDRPKTDSYTGASSYRIDARLVEPYVEKR